MPASSPAARTAEKSDNPDFKTELLGLVPFLRAFARSLTGNQEGADDLAQETLVKAWQSRASLHTRHQSEGLAVPPFCATSSIPTAAAPGARRPGTRRAAERIPGGGEDQLFSAELSDTARALRRLSDEQREALILVGAGGFSYEDAAAICKCAVGTVKSRVARARKTLIDILDGDDTLQGVSRPAEGDAAREIMAQLDKLSLGRADDTGAGKKRLK